jgi:hypothetical protein
VEAVTGFARRRLVAVALLVLLCGIGLAILALGEWGPDCC